MRYVYSTIRYVPSLARGEFVNVGIIAVADDEYLVEEIDRKDMRVVSNWNRAALFGGGDATKLHNDLGYFLGTMNIPNTVKELKQIQKDHHGVIQFGTVFPAIGNSAKEVVDRLWAAVILE